MLNCLPPICRDNPKILILGTMPGKESLAKNEYFAHRQNRFWKLLFKYFDVPLSDDYCIRIKLVTNNQIALWDTVKSCQRADSSLDSHIKNVVLNDIPLFLQNYRSIRAVFLNGLFAAKFYTNNKNDFLQQHFCDAVKENKSLPPAAKLLVSQEQGLGFAPGFYSPNNVKENTACKSAKNGIENKDEFFKKDIKEEYDKSDINAVVLPSTSPANALYSFDRLYGIWSQALDKYLK